MPSLSRYLAWRPEWPAVVMTAISWVALGWLQFESGHSAHHASAGGTSAAATLAVWTLMSFAMMMPVTLPAVRHVGLNSLRIRRMRAMTSYVAAYLAVWIVFGAAAIALAGATRRSGVTGLQSIVGALIVAAIWQVTGMKRRAVLACRKAVPLPPVGWRANLGCVRFGVLQAWRCVIACWPLMLLMALVNHSLWLMIALTMVVMAEERAPRRERLLAPIAVLLGGAAAALMFVAM